MAKPPPTSSGTGRLSELARHVIVPSGIVSTGWPAVRDKCAELDITFDPWQDGAGRLVLAKRADGLYATSVGGVVISIPRQVGKTFLIGAIVFALCLLFPNLTVIWTAHRLRTAAETFASMQAMARRPKIKPLVARIVLGSGDEEIRFHNGSRVLFGARERGFGRGFSGVDVLVFDEAQILTENAIDDMVPATNQAPNPLILFTGTPPKPSDPGEVFLMKRTEALAGGSDDTVYIEFSADREADPLDRNQWRKANPSYPRRTPQAAMLRMKKNLTEDSFLREAMGIWDDLAALGVFPTGTWADCVDETSKITTTPVFGLDVSNDRQFSTLSACGARDDALLHLETVVNRPGTDWVVDETVEKLQKHGGSVVVDPASPAGSLIDDLEQAGAKVHQVTARDYAQACGWLYDAVKHREVRRLPEPELTTAERNTKKRDLAGGFAWDRKNAEADITPLVAVTLACWGYRTFGGDILESVW